ncbi:hypothetical protein GOODEAATRI_004977, partial [Goodea atripinnis]
ENYGDISQRVELRDKLKCKSFEWYLRNIYPDLHVPEDREGWHGAVRSLGLQSECLDYNAPDHNPTGAQLSLFGCHGQGGNQDGTIYHPHSNMCVTAYRTTEGRTDAQMRQCNLADRNQLWKFEW